MLSEEVKKLEEKCKHLEDLVFTYSRQVCELKEKNKEWEKLCEMLIPNKVYVHKSRRNTTVKFLDGSQVTVKRKVGEKNCIETAIAYCILKQLLPAKDLKKLVEEREEH